MMPVLPRAIATLDQLQQRHRGLAILYAVVKKSGNDSAGQYVVALGWYGFTAIYPLLLVVVTVLGFIGVASLGHGIVSTLHRFPVVGSQFNPARPSRELHGSVPGLVIGLVGLLYGSQGVTQTGIGMMEQVWNIPGALRPGFVARLGRSLTALLLIGATFLANAAVSTYATASGTAGWTRALVILAMVVGNMLLFTASFRALTPTHVDTTALVPGAALAGIGFTLLITVGSALVFHQVRNSSATYGQFGVVIGLVAFLLLLAKLCMYCAELNVVLARRLWPRGLRASHPTVADHQVLRAVAHQQRQLPDQRIGVGFGPHAAEAAARDARRDPSDDAEVSSQVGVADQPEVVQ